MTERPLGAKISVPSRREFLRTSTAAAVAGSLAGTLALGRSAHAAGSDVLKIGLPTKVIYIRGGQRRETTLTPAARK